MESVAVIALVVSIIGVVVSGSLAVIRVGEWMRDRETRKRAELSVTVERERYRADVGPDREAPATETVNEYLVISNVSANTARQVRHEVTTDDDCGLGSVGPDAMDIAAGGSRRLMLRRSFASDAWLTLKLTWTDDSGDRSEEHQLSLL